MDTNLSSKFAKQLEATLNPTTLNELGREVGFVERLRLITPATLIPSLISDLGARKVETIADLHRGFNFLADTNTAYKAFYMRLARKEFPELMKKVLEQLLDELMVETLELEESGPLARFKDVRIQDGTSFAVKSTLSEVFPGRFTKIEPAAVEIHAHYSARYDQVTRVTLTPDSAAERAELPDVASLKDCLLLADRGYPATDFFKALDAAGGFYVMRLTKSWKPRVHAEWRNGKLVTFDTPVKLDEFLKKNAGRALDLVISLAKDKHRSRFRLVLIPNQSKRKKKDDWIRLCTNLPVTDFSAALVSRIYRFRWQIELVFKDWKSYANLHKFDTGNEHIAEGLIWASLCAAIIKRFIAHASQRTLSIPVSTRRTAMLLHHYLSELMNAIAKRDQVSLRRTWNGLLQFIAINGRRSNPRRDKKKGRLSPGLRVLAAA